MNWEAFSTIAELVSAIAVVISLLYLALQIRQNTHQVRVATNHEISHDLREATRNLLSAGKTEMYVRGLEDPQSLDRSEQLDFAFFMFDLFKGFENIHYHYLHGTIGADVWPGWCYFIRSYAIAPGAQRYWRARRDIFHPEFRAFIESIEPNQEFKRVGDVFGKQGS